MCVALAAEIERLRAQKARVQAQVGRALVLTPPAFGFGLWDMGNQFLVQHGRDQSIPGAKRT